MSNLSRHFSLVPMIFGDLEKEANRLLGGNFEFPSLELSDWQLSVDVIDEPKQFVVRADIPGVDPKNIEINIDRNALIIKGQKETEFKEKKENFMRYERSKGSFYRKIVLPETVDADKISAKSKNGVLEITIPKSEKGKPKKIEIQS